MILHCMGDDYRDEAKIWSAAMWTCGSCSAIAWQGKRGIYGICTKIYHIIMIRLLLMFSPKFAVHFACFLLAHHAIDVRDTPKRAFWCPEECALEAKINKVREKEPMVFPIPSMYGIFTYIWLIFMVNVGKYTIHGSHGISEMWRVTFSPGDPC